MNSARTKDEELDNIIDRIVSGLFSVMVTMGMNFLGNISLATILANSHSRDANYTMSKRSGRRDDLCEA